MNQQPNSWISLSKRTPEIQGKVQDVFIKFADKSLFQESSDLYDDLEWGFIAQADLYRGLIESTRLQRCLMREEIESIAPSGPSPQIDHGIHEPDYDDTTIVDLVPNDVDGKSLSWFVAHPPNPEIGIKASDILDERILDLYVTHVNETGETYFPQLESQLRAYYELIANQ